MLIGLRVLTILFGALPASWLSFWVLIVTLLAAAAVIAERDLSGVIFVIWGLAGLYGTVSLWAVGFGCDDPLCIRGLAVGIAAILPFAPVLDPRHLVLNGDINLLAVACLGPLVVAITWLAIFLIRRKREGH